jgi:hypothetical protein
LGRTVNQTALAKESPEKVGGRSVE